MIRKLGRPILTRLGLIRPPEGPGDRGGPLRPLFFMHLVKTAGTTVREILRRHYGPDEFYSPPDGPELETMPVAQLRRFRCIAGHVDHRFLARFQERPRVMVFLRDPVDRVMSHYWFHRGLPVEDAPNETDRQRRAVAQALDFDAYLRSDDPVARRVTDNYQTRMIAGHPHPLPIDDPTGLLSRALDHLNAYDIIGLAERMQASIDGLCRAAGWAGPVSIPRLNATAGRPPRSALASATLDLVLQRNQLDLQLYAAARDLFRKRTAPRTGASAPARAGSRGGA